MGPAEGLSTQYLHEEIKDLEVVDASELYLNLINVKLPGIKCHQSLFETFEPNRRYDNIYMGHVLEHIEEPSLIITRAVGWLKPGGRIIASVPNADSIHRKIGVRIGIIKNTSDLSESDVRIGHRRVFRRKEFEALFEDLNLKIIESSGFFLKFFPNSELEESFSEEFILELMRLGQQSPENSAELFLVATTL